MSEISSKNFEKINQTELFQQISDICSTVNLVKDAKELLDHSLVKTLQFLGANRGSIFILAENGQDLILMSSYGMKIGENNDLVKRLGEGVVGRVATSKKPMVVTDISSDERFKNYRARKSYRTPSFICAPLLIKDKLLGVINVADKACGSKFTRNELQLLDFLATQIALNHRRIQLYQKFKVVLQESRALKSELGKSSEEAHHLRKQVVLQEKLATIGKLAGGIAHEFNNPLDGVMRYTNLCLDHVRPDDVTHGYLLEIKNGLNRMANIVKSLLACSRNAPPSLHRVDINQAVEQVLKALQPDILQKNVTVEMDLAPDIPEILDLGLERIVTNIIRNAVDALDTRGGVRIRTAFKDRHIYFEVADTGCGVPEANLERIFEPFFTTKDIDKGCGLGLTIVSEIVKSYSGRIDIESKPGLGTTFVIVIPAS